MNNKRVHLFGPNYRQRENGGLMSRCHSVKALCELLNFIKVSRVFSNPLHALGKHKDRLLSFKEVMSILAIAEYGTQGLGIFINERKSRHKFFYHWANEMRNFSIKEKGHGG